MAKRRISRALAIAKDYNVNLPIAKKIDKSTYKIDRRSNLVSASVIAIGRELITIKSLMPHGAFRPFVKKVFSFSFRLGEMWMNCVPFADKNLDIIDRIPLTELYKLAAPRTPDSVRDRVCADMRAGQKCPSLETVTLLIKEARAAENVSGDCLNPALKKARIFEPSTAGRALLSLFAANIPKNKLGTTAFFLDIISSSDLKKIASKIRFKALGSQQLSRPDAEMEASCAFGA